MDVIEGIEASCIDAANPCVFVLAEALGKTGSESPQELEADPQFLARMAAIREAGAAADGHPRLGQRALGGDGVGGRRAMPTSRSA